MIPMTKMLTFDLDLLPKIGHDLGQPLCGLVTHVTSFTINVKGQRSILGSLKSLHRPLPRKNVKRAHVRTLCLHRLT